MVQEKGGFVSRQLEVLWTSGTLTGMSDAQLVSRFTGVRDTTPKRLSGSWSIVTGRW